MGSIRVSRVGHSFNNRKYLFTVLLTSILSAKSARIYSRLPLFSALDLISWSPLFYAQDIFFLLFTRYLFGRIYNSVTRRPHWLTVATLVTGVAVLLCLSATSITVIVVTGSEISWHNIGFINNLSAVRMFWIAAIRPFTTTLVCMLLSSWLFQDPLYNSWGLVVNILSKCILLSIRRLSFRCFKSSHARMFKEKSRYDLEFTNKGIESSGLYSFLATTIPRILAGFVVLVELLLAFIHPYKSSLLSLLWTLPLMPLVHIHKTHSLGHHLDIPSPFSSVHQHVLDLRSRNLTALTEPPTFPWIPTDTYISGFADWRDPGDLHYNATADPLRVSNMGEELLPDLRPIISSINIQHIVLIILESTRSDVFPFKKNSLIWNRMTDSYTNKTLPQDIQELMTELTPTANFLTGDYNDGFDHTAGETARGGLYATNAVTTGTYTLKSLTGTLCGVMPLAAPFNLEISNHIYQPCLAHVFEALNTINQTESDSTKEFLPFNWKSSFMQAVTGEFDDQDILMSWLGYQPDEFISVEYLESDDAKFGPTDVPDVNYFGKPESVLEKYIRDAFSTATENDERVFLTHLTSTTHHPYEIPGPEEYLYDPETDEEATVFDNMSKYVSAVGYVDRWLGKLLNILEEQDVANETLVVVVGDHGISLPENEAITTYNNGNIGNFHIPLVISHPQLPAIQIDGAVTTLQILPTIMDLLLESGSITGTGAQAARDLLHNYEGQSLIRPLSDVSSSGQGNWQFTVTNPGDAILAVRDARRPHWRLVVPILGDYEWRFTDLVSDPHEESPLLAFDCDGLLTKVERKYGQIGSQWVQEAILVADWWISENHKRWRYDPLP
ncbi:alkaline-phosphatase-like protein [Xylariales sp. PMI_506]|nr:alkaline-phosphatase-like protein [Xylariales sp. PMI_506]